jgi:hypothetical protein
VIYLTKEKAEHISKGILSVVIDKSIEERVRILEDAGTTILKKYNTKEECENCLYEEERE